MRKHWKIFRAAGVFIAWWIAVTASAAPPPIQPDSWTLAILPDTQYYSFQYPDVFKGQTQFLADNKAALNIQYVLHEGDITQSNSPGQWTVASDAFKTLEQADIPYSLALGNHDYHKNALTRESRMSEYFPVTRLKKQPTFGGVWPAEPALTNNSYSLFSAGNTDWLVISLEYGPRDKVLDWADGLLKRFPRRKAMIVTHSYLTFDGTRTDWAAKGAKQKGNPHDNNGDGTADNQGISTLPGGVNDGQQTWNALKDNPNLLLVFNGHHTNPAFKRPLDPLGAGSYLASPADDGHVVHQLFANYQNMPHGGQGYLRLLEFLPNGKTVHVRTYSPWRNARGKKPHRTEANQDFMIQNSPLLPGEGQGVRAILPLNSPHPDPLRAPHSGRGERTCGTGFKTLSAPSPESEKLSQVTKSTEYGARREDFLVGPNPNKGFVILPDQPAADGARPWIWYAPTFVRPGNAMPDPSHGWLFTRLLAKGFAIAGVDVGESYGSPGGRAVYTDFYRAVVAHYHLAPKACLLPQSRGGLMLYNWAAEHPGAVQCIGGIYTVCDPSSWPGLAQACPAYGMTEAELKEHLAEHNPIDRLAPLAKAKIPILHVHGDVDTLVPLPRNSGELIKRYTALGGNGKLVVIHGKGHEVCDEFFKNPALLEFFLRQKEKR
ncbi:MAG: metallophosphoesterase [Pirellulales bacterium]|nr:metallophosphoesterase [Pirellulales bacterium]